MEQVYLAAPFEWKERVKEYADQLTSLGYGVTSRWLDQEENITSAGGGTLPGREELIRGFAYRDIRNILECDTLILFNPGVALIRNTRLAEFGGALFTGRQCIVIGPEESLDRRNIDTIFALMNIMPEDLALLGIKPVKTFQTWREFLDYASKGPKHCLCALMLRGRIVDSRHCPIHSL